jgi:hypothetical protein
MADAPDLGSNPRLARRVSTGRIVAFPRIFSQSVFPIAPVAPDAPDSSAKVAQKSAVPKSGTTITRSGEAIGDSIAAHLDPDRVHSRPTPRSPSVPSITVLIDSRRRLSVALSSRFASDMESAASRKPLGIIREFA